MKCLNRKPLSLLLTPVFFAGFFLFALTTPGLSQAKGSGSIVGTNIFAEIAKKENPAVVNISTTTKAKPRPPRLRGRMGPPSGNPFQDFFERFLEPNPNIPKRSLGSGFIIDKEGHIFTNNHVVKDAVEIKVTLMDQKEYSAEIVGIDPKTDIALIKINAENGLPVIELGNSDKVEVGEWVMAIGNPFGLNHTVTVGVVSAKGRMIGSGPYDHYIQTDASINPGNSGGPLINNRGEVIGINTAIMSGNTGGNIGIGFAIPINMAKQILEELKTKGSVTRGWLGVMIQKISPEMTKSLKLKNTDGALVGDVVPESPADKAGIERGDVILEFDGKKVKTMEDLPRLVAAIKPGKEVDLVVFRKGKNRSFRVKIETLKDSAEVADAVSQKLGMNVQEITPELAENLKLESPEGVLVADVEFGSPAGKAGVRRGDIILEINRSPVNNVEAYQKAVKDIKEGDNLLVLVKRGSGTIFVAITVS